ncbi:hypothetical protein [Sediminicola sp. 1XM1-17]|uniref:hypothetical protein n=1 Tax=Sediminicola sp. 1XM1-17 TaxID=3127702 RepID=UPI0030781D6F
MKTVKHYSFVSLLLLFLFWGVGNTVFSFPQSSVPLNSHSGNEIKVKELLNKEGVIFNFQHQEFETALQLSSLDKPHSGLWMYSKRTAPLFGDLRGYELQYINYSKTIEPGLDSLTMIFPFHTYI